jgi:glycosyltransferase involved in cell wall biosynthesis
MLSIVIPTYNRSHLIDFTLLSALSVMKPDDEVIIRDNCSTDGTLEILRRRALSDKRIRFIRASSNEGPVRNWQKALEAARGDISLLLFSDDLLLPDGFSELRERFESTMYQVAFGTALIGNEPSEAKPAFCLSMGSGILPAKKYLSYMLRRLGSVPVSPSAYFFRTEALLHAVSRALQDLGHNQDALSTGAGIDLLIVSHAVMAAGECLYHVKPHVFFRQHNTSLSTSREVIVQRLYRESRVLLARHYLGPTKATIAALQYSIAWRLKSMRRVICRNR